MGIKSKLACFDFETSGLDKNKNLVMEFAFVTSNQFDFEIETEYSELLKPYKLKVLEKEIVQIGKKKEKIEKEVYIEKFIDAIYDKRALEVHGISIAETSKKGIEISEFVKTLIKLFKELNPTRNKHPSARPILCGHNVSFDVSFLVVIFELCGEKLSEHVLSNNDEIIVWDSLQLSQQVYNKNEGEELSLNLKDCFQREGFGEFLAHRALPDTQTTLKLIGALIDKIRSGKTSENKVEEKKAKRIQKSERKKLFKF